jgi:hypothetical protein
MYFVALDYWAATIGGQGQTLPLAGNRVGANTWVPDDPGEYPISLFDGSNVFVSIRGGTSWISRLAHRIIGPIHSTLHQARAGSRETSEQEGRPHWENQGSSW